MTDPSAAPRVQYDSSRGWICSCTGIWVERVDLDLDCHHWPMCEHIMNAARTQATGRASADTKGPSAG